MSESAKEIVVNESVQEVAINENTIKNLIYVIRGQQVMLDSDLAMLYQVETKALKMIIMVVADICHMFHGTRTTLRLTCEKERMISALYCV